MAGRRFGDSFFKRESEHAACGSGSKLLVISGHNFPALL
jgi:hypothetical protein